MQLTRHITTTRAKSSFMPGVPGRALHVLNLLSRERDYTWVSGKRQ